MAAQIFKNILLNATRHENIYFKCSRPTCHASNVVAPNVHKNNLLDSTVQDLNERNYLKSHSTVLHKQTYTGSALYNHKGLLTRGVITNPCHNGVNMRSYTTLPNTVVSEAVKYNTGFFQIISESFPVQCVTDLLRFTHYNLGLPWWLTIIIPTIAARMLMHLPLMLIDHQSRAKQMTLEKEMKDVAERLKMEMFMKIQSSRLDRSQAAIIFNNAMAKERREMYERENCHPFKSVATICLQMPIWISFSVAIRNISYMLPALNPVTLQDYQGLINGGIGWIKNLADVDHFFVLPIFLGFSSLAIIEMNEVLYNAPDTRFRKIFRNIHRGIIICFIPITAFLPSSITLYWVTNNCCAMIQNLLFMSPKFRRLGGIPKTKLELQHPYAELFKRLLSKLQLKKSIAKRTN